MNLKTIIASLVLGSSSLAMASPSVTFTASAQGSYGTSVVRDRIDPDCDEPAPAPIAQPYEQPVYGQPVYGQPYEQPYTQPYEQPYAQPAAYPQGGFWRGGRWLPPAFRPVVLASGMHFASDGRTFIKVGPQAGRFATLQLSAASGRTFITQVYVQFDNGQEQVIRNLDRVLVRNQSLTLDLDGNRRGIARIVVYGGDIRNGWRRSGGTFNVIAS
ncbi:MAG TPA: hypothetical protein VGD80_35275 [Kofleriaceae bacterium]